MTAQKKFKALQARWYKRLEKEGFKDIENTRLESRPLKEWHSFKMASKRFQTIQATDSLYQKKISDFINHSSFDSICKALIKHGNSKFTEKQIRIIWELHIQGLTTRKIAKQLKRVKSRIDDVLKGLRSWMQLTL